MFLKLPNLYMLIKQKSISLSRNLVFETFAENSVLNKGKFASPLFNGLEVLSSASGKSKFFAENLS